MLYELLILDTSAELKPYQFYKNGKCIAEGTATVENLIKLYFEVYLCDVKFVSEFKAEIIKSNIKKLNCKKNMSSAKFTTFCNILEIAECLIQSGGEKGSYWVIVDYVVYEKTILKGGRR